MADFQSRRLFIRESLRVVALSALALLFASGAALASGSETQAAKPKVVTTFTIIADMARNVAGDLAEVASITKAGAEIHNYQPTPGDILGAQGADLVLDNGMNLELWFERFLQNLGDVRRVTVSDGVEPISISGGAYDGKPNPHAWMSLANAMIYVDNIARALGEIDPANAAAYLANAATYKERLEATVGPLREAVRALPQEQQFLVTSEGAFSYLARDYGLREFYLWPINADQQGSPRQVQAVIDAVRANAIDVVFSESTVSPKPAEQVARETGARFGGVLYVDSLSEADGPVPTYLDLLRVTSTTILNGLSGS
jgi:manganese/iron transport system substrate-binding protein